MYSGKYASHTVMKINSHIAIAPSHWEKVIIPLTADLSISSALQPALTSGLSDVSGLRSIEIRDIQRISTG